MRKQNWLRNNSLSIVFFLLFVVSLAGQAYAGWLEYNNEMEQDGGQPTHFTGYLSTAHFVTATFENWESEFLQMMLFVVLSMFLYQKGSSESKDPDEKNKVEEEPDPGKNDAPWPVKAGGIMLSLYKNSLSYALFVLFLLSFLAHFWGSLADYNEQQKLKALPAETATQFLGNSKFWFESFQNWQSEFLSVLAIVVLSIFLRQKGSPQSKPVDAPNTQTGE